MNPPMNLRHRQHQQQRFYTASAKHEDLPPQESGFYPDDRFVKTILGGSLSTAGNFPLAPSLAPVSAPLAPRHGAICFQTKSSKV